MNAWRVKLDLVEWNSALAWRATITAPGETNGVTVVDDDAEEAVACAVRVIRNGRHLARERRENMN